MGKPTLVNMLPMLSRSLASSSSRNLASSSRKISTHDRIRGAFFGALVSDALSLGSHYEYDAPKIKQAYGGTISKYMAPGEMMGGETHGIGWGAKNFHPGTVAGDQTDYGEYNVLLLEHLAHVAETDQAAPFDLAALIPTWQQRLSQNWKQWVCTQTRQTWEQLEQGTPLAQLGGMSNAMALRYAAAFAYYDSEDAVVDVAIKAMFTHREHSALIGGEFFARVTFRVMHHSLSPREAIQQVAADMDDPWIEQKVNQAIAKVAEAVEEPLASEEFVDDLALTSMARLWEVGKSEPIKVGKASPTEGTLPGAIYFILKYKSFEKAAVANAMVGGDNASRAVAIGMVLGASQGVSAIPADLKDSLNHWEHSEMLLRQLPLLK